MFSRSVDANPKCHWMEKPWKIKILPGHATVSATITNSTVSCRWSTLNHENSIFSKGWKYLSRSPENNNLKNNSNSFWKSILIPFSWDWLSYENTYSVEWVRTRLMLTKCIMLPQLSRSWVVLIVRRMEGNFSYGKCEYAWMKTKPTIKSKYNLKIRIWGTGNNLL